MSSNVNLDADLICNFSVEWLTDRIIIESCKIGLASKFMFEVKTL